MTLITDIILEDSSLKEIAKDLDEIFNHFSVPDFFRHRIRGAVSEAAIIGALGGLKETIARIGAMPNTNRDTF